MRAAIAKRFSGDAAPVLPRFFRISVGLGLARRVLVRGAQHRACIKTSTRLALTTVIFEGIKRYFGGTNMNDLISDFENSALDSTIDLSMDVLEISIDELCENEIIKNIPFIKTVVTVYKVGTAIYERNLMKNTLQFIKKFNAKTINPQKLEKYRKRLYNNPNFAEDELGRVLFLLNKTIDSVKAGILANLFKNYVEETISWEQFCELSDITDRIFVADIDMLSFAYQNNGVNLYDFANYHLDRLISLGVLENEQRIGANLIINANFDEDKQKNLKDVSITDLGKLFYECGLKNAILHSDS